ncbi:Hypothetical predicted protein [Olea europaea subsp. europaea]|uniref:Transmembrane protein n=1 Tax=Olea europaea subsp. europaea TaxID=158383 RepID=A0A8S0SDE1_OLEEU|nr:Hypothetical predicted protein [Olea europaea subsp. europaea]
MTCARELGSARGEPKSSSCFHGPSRAIDTPRQVRRRHIQSKKDKFCRVLVKRSPGPKESNFFIIFTAMGRKIPIAESSSNNHHLISFSLFIVCIAATMAVISSLCGSLSRKKPPRPSEVDNANTENSQLDISSNGKDASNKSPGEVEPSQASQPEDIEQQRPLPPPPFMQHKRAASYHHRSNSTASSHGKLSSSMSMRVLGNAISSRKEEKKEKKLKHEDSVWKKTIILGEKCRVPQEDDDTILYDEKGNRISTYHQKTPSTVFSMSRQNSGINSDAVPT